MVGYCRFCGQSRMIDGDKDMTEEERNELATDLCTCEKATHYAWKKATLENFEQDIEMFFGSVPELREMLLNAGAMVIDGQIKRMTVQQTEGKMISLAMKDRGLCLKVTEKSHMENISYA